MANTFFGNMSQNVVKDEEASAYYTQRALWIFSILFGVLFGSVLMAINVSKSGKKSGAAVIICFGIAYTVIEIWALNALNATTSATFFFNGLGALILQYFFWNKYIGADTLYRAKPVWIPSIIGVIMMSLFILAILYGG